MTDAGRAPDARILIVEPSTEIRRALEDGLGMQGYAVRSVGSADEVLDALRDDACDLVVVDVDTETDGTEEVLERLRDTFPELPAIVVGARGFDSLDVGGTGRTPQARRVIARPFTLGRLLAAVRAELDGYHPDERPRR